MSLHTDNIHTSVTNSVSVTTLTTSSICLTLNFWTESTFIPSTAVMSTSQEETRYIKRSYAADASWNINCRHKVRRRRNAPVTERFEQEINSESKASTRKSYARLKSMSLNILFIIPCTSLIISLQKATQNIQVDLFKLQMIRISINMKKKKNFVTFVGHFLCTNNCEILGRKEVELDQIQVFGHFLPWYFWWNMTPKELEKYHTKRGF